jgi:hypothetical protein
VKILSGYVQDRLDGNPPVGADKILLLPAEPFRDVRAFVFHDAVYSHNANDIREILGKDMRQLILGQIVLKILHQSFLAVVLKMLK